VVMRRPVSSMKGRLVSRGWFGVVDVWAWARGAEGGNGRDGWGSGALAPGLSDQLPGELGRVKRRVVWAWVIGASGGRLTRAGESGRRAVVVMARVGLGASSLTAFRLGRRLQSSIRSRGADQSVVRCSGAQSNSRPSCSMWRRPDTGASSPEPAPRALVVSASLV
jgi:hypothetical protein